ncbi:MAG TPA: efflux RND transporter periplasmic adaptor subunit [Caulobacteraceae bacterium]|nr:efflux RND transporter periplasmic adaptor subunit [Caulobacteraceae bacterium]
MTPPARRFRWGFVALGVLLVGLIAWLALGNKPAKPKATPPVAVTLARATAQDVPLYVTALGAAQAWQGVLINPQINGRLTYVAKEGDDVRVGSLLVEIDCGPYQAALTQAQGALRRDQAALAGARVDLARYQTLTAQNSIARQTMEDEEATVKQDEGVVLADQGSVRAAQVNVAYCRIPSPVNGRVGVRLVDPGNIVSTTLTTGIISVNQIQPIAVTFTIPQGQFQHLSDLSAGFTRPLATEALSQDTGEDLGAGELIVADNHVDQTTGSVTMKARFENPERQLWPGEFVNVRVTLQTLPHATTIPSAAVNQGPNGPYAYVVVPGNKVAARPVVVAANQGGIAVIQSGVQVGDMVVTDGQMSLRPGSVIAAAGAPASGAAGAKSGRKRGS